MLRELRDMLMAEEKKGPVERFMEIDGILEKEGVEITSVNPLALRDARLMLPMELRAQVVDRAIQSL